MDDVSKLIERIGMIHVQSVPLADWDEINFVSQALVTLGESQSSFTRQGVATTYAARVPHSKSSSDYASSLALELRKAMYDFSPEKGAWFGMKMTIKASGDFDVNFDYESRPKFSIEMDDEDFIKDYRAFPRPKEILQAWLFEILSRNKIL
jgi:hypothetical protein